MNVAAVDSTRLVFAAVAGLILLLALMVVLVFSDVGKLIH